VPNTWVLSTTKTYSSRKRVCQESSKIDLNNKRDDDIY